MSPTAAAAPGAATAHAGGPSKSQLLLIVNPRASRFDADEVAASVRALGEAFAVSTSFTEGPGHAGQIAREAAREGFVVVAAAGGDGTLSETASGLSGSGTAMACLPMGCTNVFARAVGSPRRLVPAARRLAAMAAGNALPVRSVDLGTVNGRPFLCTAGVGFSASMTAAADARAHRKAQAGQLHFAAAAASELGRRYLRTPPQMRVTAGGESAQGVTAVIQNARALTYFGPREIRACPAAGLDTGAISVTLLRRVRPGDLPGVVGRLVSGRVLGHPQVESFPDATRATIVSADGAALPLEADGEYLGEHHSIEFGVLPRTLRVVA